MSSPGKMYTESCDDPLVCGKLAEYMAALKEAKCDSQRNICVHLYNTDRCKATCISRKQCATVLGKKFTPEMRDKIPSARLLPGI